MMTRNDNFEFRPRFGRVRDRRARSGYRSRSFVGQVLAAAIKANGGVLPPAQMREQRARTDERVRPRKGRCCRIGRGQGVADRLKFIAGERGRAEHMRRVVIKARIVRLKLGSRGTDAHVRYLERDGTTHDGERGRLYAVETDEVDGKTFIERGREDRHQFRFIVAPEDGDKFSDLRAFTRNVMRQMEKDLGTGLDWVAVDHFNTGHPHSHVLVRGRDDFGKDLIIAQDYITDGMRLRAQHLATLELGPETDLELRAKLQADVAAERLTTIDRAMLLEARDRMLDLRAKAGQIRADFDRTLRIGRLQNLERYGLAREGEPGLWTLSEDLEPTLRGLGERSDIVKAMSRALAKRGQQRELESYDLHGEETSTPIVGRLIDKRLTDELTDQIGLIIDGIDGRVHHAALRDSGDADEATIGSIVEVGRATSRRPADRNIAQIADGSGEYRPSVHRASVEAASSDVPGGDYDAYVEAHVRRLEKLRRAGIAERVNADCWHIPQDFQDRAAACDAAKGRQASIRILSAYDLDRQVTSDGATWLDRELMSGNRRTLSVRGFGAEVRQALADAKMNLSAMGTCGRRLTAD